MERPTQARIPVTPESAPAVAGWFAEWVDHPDASDLAGELFVVVLAAGATTALLTVTEQPDGWRLAVYGDAPVGLVSSALRVTPDRCGVQADLGR